MFCFQNFLAMYHSIQVTNQQWWVIYFLNMIRGKISLPSWQWRLVFIKNVILTVKFIRCTNICYLLQYVEFIYTMYKHLFSAATRLKVLFYSSSWWIINKLFGKSLNPSEPYQQNYSTNKSFNWYDQKVNIFGRKLLNCMNTATTTLTSKHKVYHY